MTDKKCVDYIKCCCDECLNFYNYFGTRCFTKDICELSSAVPYSQCKELHCRKCCCDSYESTLDGCGCMNYVI